jgi:hypothetical protein
MQGTAVNEQWREAGMSVLRLVERALAVVAVGAVARRLWYGAVDAFIFFVLGDPAEAARPPRSA